MKPASGLCPKCWANATVLRSIDTNIAPSSRYTGASTTSPGAAAPRTRAGRPAVGAAGRSGRTATGSVPRWAANHSVPSTHSRAADADAGGGEDLGREQRHGGRADDEAQLVGDRLEGERGVQPGRAREQDAPAGPDQGAQGRHGRRPRSLPARRRPRSAGRSSTAAMSIAVATVNTVSSGSSTRRWPRESTSRAIRGEVNA